VVGFINVFDHMAACEVFVECLCFCQARGDFVLLAWVLMPNHFHLVIKRAENKNISEVIGGLKRYTARQIGQLRAGREMERTLDCLRHAASRESGKGTAIWKPRFDSFVITSECALRQKIEYCHTNPVRKHLVQETWQWHNSSASAYAGIDGIDVAVDTDWRCLGYDRMPSGKDS
jgi:REP element-mobilizing transposase RayT